jgi:hypothetical protein
MNPSAEPETPIRPMAMCFPKSIQNLRLAVLMTVALATSGCAAAALAVGAAATYGTVKYVKNEMTREYHAGLGDTWNATVAEMRKMGYEVSNQLSHGPTEGLIEIRDAWVKVEKLPGDLTRVRVRFGTFETTNSHRKAELLLTGVTDRLQKAPETA